MRHRITFPFAVLSLTAATFLTAPARAERSLTFSRDIAPILQKNCQECHRPGEAVPMTLMTYDEVRPWAKSIRKVVEDRIMPPWHADPAVGKWSNDRSMPADEIAMLTAWVDQGAPEGDPADLPPPLEFTEGWKIGEPDLILEMTRDEKLPPSLTDEYRYVMIPTKIREDRWIEAAEVRPGNIEVVHHVIVFIASMSAMMSGNPEEGLRGALGGYAPGVQPLRMGEGEGIFLPANSVLVLQMHYHKEEGIETTDRTRIGLRFAEGPIERMMGFGAADNFSFRIPAGEPNHPVRGAHYISDDILLKTVVPHMHYRGKNMTVWAVFPDGTRRDIISVPRYDFNWQTFYDLAEPMRLPAGTRIEALAHFDNSAGNPANPDPTVDVTFGMPTTDEMMFAFFMYTREFEEGDQHKVSGGIGL